MAVDAARRAKKVEKAPPPKPKVPVKKPAPKPEAAAPHAPVKVAAGGPVRDGLAQTGKGKFQRPVDGGQVTSRFGHRDIGAGREMHNGLDIAVPEGTPVKAAAAGKVVKTGNEPGGAGNYVVVDHGGGYQTKYFHLSKIDVKEGQTVEAGEEIAKSGNTGRSTGPHLHFEIIKDGKAVDPEPYLDGKPAELNLDEAGQAPIAPGGNAPRDGAPAIGAPVAGGPAAVAAAPRGAAPGGAPGGAPAAAGPGGAPAAAAPGGAPAAPAAPAVQLTRETTNLLDLLKQFGIPEELIALLLELLQNGQLDEAQFQDLAKQFMKGDATEQDLQAMADQAKQNPPLQPAGAPIRDGMAPGAPNQPGLDVPAQGNGKGADAVREAQTWLGTPYVFGGNGRGGIDCSGLVQQVYNKLGVNLPRTAAEQAKVGTEIPKDQLQPGDLVYFKGTYKPGVSHIGIYIGDGKMIHAPKTGDVVKVADINSGYYQQKWGGARRV